MPHYRRLNTTLLSGMIKEDIGPSARESATTKAVFDALAKIKGLPQKAEVRTRAALIEVMGAAISGITVQEG